MISEQHLFKSSEHFNSDQPLDLSTNSPPINTSAYNTELSIALEQALYDQPFDQLLSKHRWNGTERDLMAGRFLLQGRLLDFSPENLVVSNGVQNALVMILKELLPEGGVLLTEGLTYPGVRFISELMGIEVVGVPTDRYGMDPEALEEFCRGDASQVLFLLPTLQNPTTITMPPERRLEIACVARKFGLPIIEDDIYALLPQETKVPVYAQAPELTWYILGLGKTLGAGLKTTYVVPPINKSPEVVFWPGARTTFWMAPPINAALTTKMIENGGVQRIVAAAREEVKRRHAIANAQLDGLEFTLGDGGFHLWLQLPAGTSRHSVAAGLLSAGIIVAKSDVYATKNAMAPEAIRIGIGNPRSSHTVQRALAIVAEQIASNAAYTR